MSAKSRALAAFYARSPACSSLEKDSYGNPFWSCQKTSEACSPRNCPSFPKGYFEGEEHKNRYKGIFKGIADEDRTPLMEPLTSNESTVFKFLKNGEKTVSEIKEYMKIGNSLAYEIMRNLYNKGFVERSKNTSSSGGLLYLYRLAKGQLVSKPEPAKEPEHVIGKLEKKLGRGRRPPWAPHDSRRRVTIGFQRSGKFVRHGYDVVKRKSNIPNPRVESFKIKNKRIIDYRFVVPYNFIDAQILDFVSQWFKAEGNYDQDVPFEVNLI